MTHRRVAALVLGVLLALTSQATAQLPDTIASANLTRAQADELNRRLATLQHRITGLAQETNLQTAAIRNIAIEIYGALPDVDFQSYARLLESGAHELRDYVNAARTRTTGTPELAALREQAINAAEDGRLSDARQLYNTLIASTRIARGRQRSAENRIRAREDISDAADIAEAARIASAAADELDAARLYAEAATLAPAGTRERWAYTSERADALVRHSERFGDQRLAEAIAIFENGALPLTTRGSADWARTQNNLGRTLALLGYRGESTAATRAIAAHNAALTVYTRRSYPSEWVETQLHLAFAHMVLGVNGDVRELREAAAAYNQALRQIRPESDASAWGNVQRGLADAYTRLAERGDDAMIGPAIDAYRAALTATPRAEQPTEWAATQHNLAMALRLRGDPQALRESVATMRTTLAIYTRNAYPAQWASTHTNLCNTLRAIGGAAELSEALESCQAALSVITRQGDLAGWAAAQYHLGQTHGAYVVRGDRSHLQPALLAMREALACYEQIGNTYWADNARRIIAQLEQR